MPANRGDELLESYPIDPDLPLIPRAGPGPLCLPGDAAAAILGASPRTADVAGRGGLHRGGGGGVASLMERPDHAIISAALGATGEVVDRPGELRQFLGQSERRHAPRQGSAAPAFQASIASRRRARPEIENTNTRALAFV
jgi:hypothetical protein